jgi:hypothetical protein
MIERKLAAAADAQVQLVHQPSRVERVRSRSELTSGHRLQALINLPEQRVGSDLLRC